MRRAKGEALDLCFDALAEAAVAGERCPMNGAPSVAKHYIAELARQGKIKVEISGRNYRTVTILTGEHAGKQTAPDPTGMRVWNVIDTTGAHKATTRSGAVPRPSRGKRTAPSAPKPLGDWDYRV